MMFGAVLTFAQDGAISVGTMETNGPVELSSPRCSCSQPTTDGLAQPRHGRIGLAGGRSDHDQPQRIDTGTATHCTCGKPGAQEGRKRSGDLRSSRASQWFPRLGASVSALRSGNASASRQSVLLHGGRSDVRSFGIAEIASPQLAGRDARQFSGCASKVERCAGQRASCRLIPPMSGTCGRMRLQGMRRPVVTRNVPVAQGGMARDGADHPSEQMPHPCLYE